MFDFQNSFNGMFGKIAPGMCRLTMNGKIAVKGWTETVDIPLVEGAKQAEKLEREYL